MDRQEKIDAARKAIPDKPMIKPHLGKLVEVRDLNQERFDGKVPGVRPMSAIFHKDSMKFPDPKDDNQGLRKKTGA